MINPWLEWWQDLQLWFTIWRTPTVLKQFATFAVVLVVALMLNGLKMNWPCCVRPGA